MVSAIENIRVDLICGISAHHVLDWLLSSGMVLNPCVNLQDTALEDDDMFAIRNKAFNISPSQDGVLSGRPESGVLHCMWCGESAGVRRVR